MSLTGWPFMPSPYRRLSGHYWGVGERNRLVMIVSTHEVGRCFLNTNILHGQGRALLVYRLVILLLSGEYSRGAVTLICRGYHEADTDVTCTNTVQAPSATLVGPRSAKLPVVLCQYR